MSPFLRYSGLALLCFCALGFIASLVLILALGPSVGLVLNLLTFALNATTISILLLKE